LNGLLKAALGLLAIGSVIALVTLLSGDRPIGSENLENRPAPDFAAPLASGSASGDSNVYTEAQARAADSVAACDVKMPGVFNSCRDLTGTAILNFWNTTKPECVAQVDTLDDWAADHEDVNVAAVAFDQHEDDVRELARSKRWTIDVPIDRDGATAGLWAVAGCPSTFFIRNGVVKTVKLGVLNSADIDRLVAGGPSS
jgi:hypothetical protein